MLLDLNKLHGPREHVERSLPPSAFDPQDPEYQVAAPVELSMDVQKAGHGIFSVTGHAKTRLQLSCSRCLEPFDVPVDTAFELRYLPQAENTGNGEDEREIEEDDLTVAYYREGLLDVVDLLREQFQLALPMKPLCRESCRGLCPQCGVNLNKTDCSCEPAWEDPRLAPLKSLLTRSKEN
jgi:uncharacterized protein